MPRGKRAAIAAFAESMLREGFPTVFALEGETRHALRSGLCLQGWAFAAADKFAADMVALAFTRMGAERPTWKQGQPEYTQEGHAPFERVFCVRCAKRLEGEQRLYCSTHCAKNHRAARADEDAKAIKRAKIYAYYAKWSAEQPEQACFACTTAFRPKRPGQIYCSKPCANRINAGTKLIKRRKRHA